MPSAWLIALPGDPNRLPNIPSQAAEFLQYSETNGKTLIHATIIPLNEYDTAMECPGPIASVRPFKNLEHLSSLIKKDLQDNNMKKNLVTSVFAQSKQIFQDILPC